MDPVDQLLFPPPLLYLQDVCHALDAAEQEDSELESAFVVRERRSAEQKGAREKGGAGGRRRGGATAAAPAISAVAAQGPPRQLTAGAAQTSWPKRLRKGRPEGGAELESENEHPLSVRGIDKKSTAVVGEKEAGGCGGGGSASVAPAPAETLEEAEDAAEELGESEAEEESEAGELESAIQRKRVTKRRRPNPSKGGNEALQERELGDEGVGLKPESETEAEEDYEGVVVEPEPETEAEDSVTASPECSDLEEKSAQGVQQAPARDGGGASASCVAGAAGPSSSSAGASSSGCHAAKRPAATTSKPPRTANGRAAPRPGKAPMPPQPDRGSRSQTHVSTAGCATDLLRFSHAFARAQPYVHYAAVMDVLASWSEDANPTTVAALAWSRRVLTEDQPTTGGEVMVEVQLEEQAQQERGVAPSAALARKYSPRLVQPPQRLGPSEDPRSHAARFKKKELACQKITGARGGGRAGEEVEVEVEVGKGDGEEDEAGGQPWIVVLVWLVEAGEEEPYCVGAAFYRHRPFRSSADDCTNRWPSETGGIVHLREVVPSMEVEGDLRVCAALEAYVARLGAVCGACACELRVPPVGRRAAWWDSEEQQRDGNARAWWEEAYDVGSLGGGGAGSYTRFLDGADCRDTRLLSCVCQTALCYAQWPHEGGGGAAVAQAKGAAEAKAEEAAEDAAAALLEAKGEPWEEIDPDVSCEGEIAVGDLVTLFDPMSCLHFKAMVKAKNQESGDSPSSRRARALCKVEFKVFDPEPARRLVEEYGGIPLLSLSNSSTDYSAQREIALLSALPLDAAGVPYTVASHWYTLGVRMGSAQWASHLRERRDAVQFRALRAYWHKMPAVPNEEEDKWLHENPNLTPAVQMERVQLYQRREAAGRPPSVAPPVDDRAEDAYFICEVLILIL